MKRQRLLIDLEIYPQSHQVGAKIDVDGDFLHLSASLGQILCENPELKEILEVACAGANEYEKEEK